MPIEIRGKQYVTVAERLNEFRSKYPISDGWSIETEMHCPSDEVVLARAEIRKGGNLLATGHAREVTTDQSSPVNASSAYENAETSAIGRALRLLGLSEDSSIASADEVGRAIDEAQVQYAKQIEHMEKVREWFQHIAVIKSLCIDIEAEQHDGGVNTPESSLRAHFDALAEAYDEIDAESMRILWRAPTKGGVWTTKEREILKSDDLGRAIKLRRAG